MEPEESTNSKMNEIIKKIVEEAPGQWPSVMKDAILDSPPESVDAAILAQIRQLPEEPAISQFQRFRFHLAAAATVIFALCAFLWFTSRPGVDAQYAGAVILERAGKIVPATEKPMNGDAYVTGPRAGAILKQGRKVFRVLADSKAVLRNTNPIDIEILEGGLIIDSGGEHDFVLRAQGVELRPMGTQAKVEIRGVGMQMSVLSGAFALNWDKQIHRIDLNEKVLISSGKLSKDKMSSAEIKALESQLGSIGDTSAANLTSIDSIRKFYGSVYSVRLQDGTSLTGFYFVKNGQPFLHTETGLIALATKQIEEIRPIQ